MSKVWKVRPRTAESVLQQVLLNRGLEEAFFAQFLQPDWERDILSPNTFKHMATAVQRIFWALETRQKIAIHGDYDADGVCGSTVLYVTLRDICERLQFPFQTEVFLPDREKDGYGVAMHTVERLAAEGVNLLITVDCGIANGLELGRAHELGVDVVVCDHHQMGEHFPDQAIVLHPLAPGEDYQNKFLCGTGVAFKLATALLTEARAKGANFPIGYEKWLLDLVAIATVTDVMPILGENRALEYFGLKVLRNSKRPGLKAILDSAGADPDSVDTQTIGFRIGPRLNAAGRLASAEIAFQTLASSTPEEALSRAGELERLNKERQQIFNTAYAEAKDLIQEQLGKTNVLVVAADTWLPGIVGLIAGRLAGDYSLPAFAFAKVGEHYVGSGRSVGGLHLVKAMEACGDMFIKRGGHPQACGLTLASRELVSEFANKMTAFAGDYFGDQGVVDELRIDAEVPFNLADLDLYTQLQQCAPFGEGNPSPVFVARRLRLVGADVLGKTGSHLRLSVVPDTGGVYKLIAFGWGHRQAELNQAGLIDVVYELGLNDWNGRREVQFRLIDVQLSST